MSETNSDLLSEFAADGKNLADTKFIPTWIRVFSFIFIVFGFLGCLIFFFGLFGFDFEASIYGLTSNDPFSIVGLTVFFIFELKAVVSFGLLKKKKWALKLGIVDALIGISICLYVMFYPFIASGGSYWTGFRLELLLLIPFLLKMLQLYKIRNSRG